MLSFLYCCWIHTLNTICIRFWKKIMGDNGLSSFVTENQLVICKYRSCFTHTHTHTHTHNMAFKSGCKAPHIVLFIFCYARNLSWWLHLILSIEKSLSPFLGRIKPRSQNGCSHRAVCLQLLFPIKCPATTWLLQSPLGNWAITASFLAFRVVA